jgi:aerobic carbon-monoxide dehydrogenase medium subunit
VDRALAARVAEAAASEVEPISDIRGDASYRRDMISVLARRTIEKLFGFGDQQEAGVA